MRGAQLRRLPRKAPDPLIRLPRGDVAALRVHHQHLRAVRQRLQIQLLVRGDVRCKAALGKLHARVQRAGVIIRNNQ